MRREPRVACGKVALTAVDGMVFIDELIVAVDDVFTRECVVTLAFRTFEKRQYRCLTTPADGGPAGVESAIRPLFLPGSRIAHCCHNLR
jgi:hypothetical protein